MNYYQKHTATEEQIQVLRRREAKIDKALTKLLVNMGSEKYKARVPEALKTAHKKEVGRLEAELHQTRIRLERANDSSVNQRQG